MILNIPMKKNDSLDPRVESGIKRAKCKHREFKSGYLKKRLDVAANVIEAINSNNGIYFYLLESDTILNVDTIPILKEHLKHNDIVIFPDDQGSVSMRHALWGAKTNVFDFVNFVYPGEGICPTCYFFQRCHEKNIKILRITNHVLKSI